jgi:beta-alanine--pyruvate transaminase
MMAVMKKAIFSNDLDACWMPFGANPAFKQSPHLLAYAKGTPFFTYVGRAVIDGSTWPSYANPGYCRASFVTAVRMRANGVDVSYLEPAR